MSQITIKTKDKETYILEFTKKSVKRMSAEGFNLDTVTEKPIIGIPALFRGAFLANHKGISAEKVDSIYDELNHKEDLVHKLVEMYIEPINALFSEPENEGNASWEVS